MRSIAKIRDSGESLGQKRFFQYRWLSSAAKYSKHIEVFDAVCTVVQWSTVNGLSFWKFSELYDVMSLPLNISIRLFADCLLLAEDSPVADARSVRVTLCNFSKSRQLTVLRIFGNIFIFGYLNDVGDLQRYLKHFRARALSNLEYFHCNLQIFEMLSGSISAI